VSVAFDLICSALLLVRGQERHSVFEIFTQGFTFAIPVRNSVSLPSFLHVDVVTLLIVLPEQLPVDRILTLRVFK